MSVKLMVFQGQNKMKFRCFIEKPYNAWQLRNKKKDY